MRSIQKLLSFLILFVFAITANSQDISNLPLKQVEDTLCKLIRKVNSENSFSLNEEANSNFYTLFKAVLGRKDVFDYPFDSLKNVGKLSSKDRKVKIFTWNLPLAGGFQKYYGFILYRKDKKSPMLFELHDSRKTIDDQVKEILGSQNWMGALYYSLCEETYKGRTYYMLLGFDFNNLFSSKKIIEVLTFGSNSEPVFGSNVFKVDDNLIARIVFEYSARATMTLRYNTDNKTIVFDHLSPYRPDLVGNFQFYGPDFTFDGFKFEKGYWVYIRNLDLRNPKREPPKLKDSPEKIPEPGFLYKSKNGLPMKISK
jgi:hypothetical protein